MNNRLLFFLLFYSWSFISNAQQRRPNIILILADDMGFSDIGCYGGEVQTPNLDQLAKKGLRYKQFYNAARCCPTRASLLTGVYPHQAGMGWMAAADLGTTAYRDNLNQQCVTIAEVLQPAGYNTYMTGKWHLTNERKIDGYVTDNWPVQRGFEKYFGIIPGGANYFTPVVYSNNARYKASGDFYLTDAISDTSVKYIEEHFSGQAGKPFFMYVAYTSPHWPLHAPADMISKYRDIYTNGWDVVRQQRFQRQQELGLFDRQTRLSPRDAQVPAWNALTKAEQQEMSMRMAIYAAQIDIMDQGIGRIVNQLKKLDQLDNTLIFFLSDNGACAEYISSGKSKAVDGTEETFESYRINWANVSSTPFKAYKHFTYEGGIATPLIVHWPEGVDKALNNRYVSEYGHLTDIMATCVDVADATYPSQFKEHTITALEGKSLLPHFKQQSNSRGRIYWEHEANIALRDGKWKLVAATQEDRSFNENSLQLYDMDLDPTEMNNLSEKYPGQVRAMYRDWKVWADKVGAFPLDTREYNARMRAYRRVINGDFNDNLGGWNTRITEDTDARFEMDDSGKITGKKSAVISMNKPGSRPAAASLNWSFPVKKGERFRVKFKTLAGSAVSFITRLEKLGDNGAKIINETVTTDQTLKSYDFTSGPVQEDGSYRLAFYFGTLKAGAKVWVDDVELIPVKN